jgi:nucleotide-binding universal stress UspA family protein
MYSRILVPIDGSEPAACGLKEAIGIASSTKATLVVINVARESAIAMDGMSMAYYNDLAEVMLQAGREMVDKAAKAAAESGVECETVVVDARIGSAWEAIVEQAAQCHCDLIVMGTHGRRGLKRMTMGSDAELVVRHCQVPVLLVKERASIV